MCLIWFDTPCTLSEAQSRELTDMVHELQPNCLVNSRIGNGLGDYHSCGDNQIPSDYMTELYEAPCTLNDTWGFSIHDNNWKSPEMIRATREKLNGMGINYLINMGPDYLGRITADSQRILREAAK